MGRAIYRTATTLSPLVLFLNPEASEKASETGDTGAVAAEAAVPAVAAVVQWLCEKDSERLPKSGSALESSAAADYRTY